MTRPRVARRRGPPGEPPPGAPPPGAPPHAPQPAGHGAIVRAAIPDDATAMARAHARSWRATYDGLLPGAVIDEVAAGEPARVERWRTWLVDPPPSGGSFVAQLDGRVVAFVFWGPSEAPGTGPEVGEVYAIYLDPDAIGRGLGRILLDAAVSAMAAHGHARAVLWVLETNDRARRFYEAAGWRPDGMTKVEARAGGTLAEVRYARAIDPARSGRPARPARRRPHARGQVDR